YAEHSVLNAETEAQKELRLQISESIAQVIRSGLGLLGIAVPERM
ncbi:MAG: anticodon binding domain, partial [Bacteroidota bacterium]